MPGTPGGTEGRKGRRERRGRVCTTDRPTRRELGRERESSERGRYRRPPTEAHRTVLRPPAPNPGRSSGTILGRGEEGRERCIREASTASSMLDPRRSPRLAGLCLGGLSRLPQGCTWRSYPSTALNAPPPRPPHTHTPARSRHWERRTLEVLLAVQGQGRVQPTPQGFSLPACRCLATFSA